MHNELETLGGGEVVEVGKHVVANVCDVAKATGLKLPPAWLGVIGRNAKQLFEEGFEPDMIVAAAWMSVLRGKPTLMQYIAGDLALASSGMRMSRAEYETKLAIYGAEKSQQRDLLAEQRERIERRNQEIDQRRQG